MRDFEALSRDTQTMTTARVANVMGKSESLVYKMMRGETPITLRNLADLSRETDCHHLRAWLAENTGWDITTRPQADESPEAGLPAMCHEFGEAVAALSQAMADGHVTAAEADSVTREINELIAAARHVDIATRARVTRNTGRAATLRSDYRHELQQRRTLEALERAARR